MMLKTLVSTKSGSCLILRAPAPWPIFKEGPKSSPRPEGLARAGPASSHALPTLPAGRHHTPLIRQSSLRTPYLYRAFVHAVSSTWCTFPHSPFPLVNCYLILEMPPPPGGLPAPQTRPGLPDLPVLHPCFSPAALVTVLIAVPCAPAGDWRMPGRQRPGVPVSCIPCPAPSALQPPLWPLRQSLSTGARVVWLRCQPDRAVPCTKFPRGAQGSLRG